MNTNNLNLLTRPLHVSDQLAEEKNASNNNLNGDNQNLTPHLIKVLSDFLSNEKILEKEFSYYWK